MLLGTAMFLGAAWTFMGVDIDPARFLPPEGRRSVEDVLDAYEDSAESRLLPYFRTADVAYPPRRVALLGLKRERTLELWAEGLRGWRLVKRYPIRAASGTAGPKLREGDQQVPEGEYEIVALNPNSAYHLSMKINYPNELDWRHAQEEGRTRLGGNIFIHGKANSIGCLAVGDSAIEELFVLVAKVGLPNTQVLIAPYDPRRWSLRAPRRTAPPWLEDLYAQLTREFQTFSAGGGSDRALGHPLASATLPEGAIPANTQAWNPVPAASPSRVPEPSEVALWPRPHEGKWFDWSE